MSRMEGNRRVNDSSLLVLVDVQFASGASEVVVLVLTMHCGMQRLRSYALEMGGAS